MLVTTQKYYQVHYSKTGEGGEYQMSVIWYVSTNRMCSNLSVATQICTVAIMSGDQSMLHTNVDTGEAEPCSPQNEFDIGMHGCPKWD